MDDMNITSAQYEPTDDFHTSPTSIRAIVDGVTLSVPLDSSNRHYAEILRQVEAGTLTIQAADSNE